MNMDFWKELQESDYYYCLYIYLPFKNTEWLNFFILS